MGVCVGECMGVCMGVCGCVCGEVCVCVCACRQAVRKGGMEVEVVGDLLPRSQALSCTPDKRFDTV